MLARTAFSFVFANFGIAIAARMPMITTTINSSIRVKPLRFIYFPSLERRSLARTEQIRVIRDPTLIPFEAKAARWYGLHACKLFCATRLSKYRDPGKVVL